MAAARWRQLALGALLLSYALLVHYSNVAKAPPLLGAALALAPLLLLLASSLWRLRWRTLTLPLMLIVCPLVLWRFWGLIERHFDLLYLCQECALYAGLGALFARTLLPGEIPLCTRWATLVHGQLSSQALRYTRAVTVLWAAFFALIVATTVLLYLYAPRSVWSLFVNFLTLPAIALLFAAEFLWRRHALPNARHATLRDMAQLFTRGARGLSADSLDASPPP